MGDSPLTKLQLSIISLFPEGRRLVKEIENKDKVITELKDVVIEPQPDLRGPLTKKHNFFYDAFDCYGRGEYKEGNKHLSAAMKLETTISLPGGRGNKGILKLDPRRTSFFADAFGVAREGPHVYFPLTQEECEYNVRANKLLVENGYPIVLTLVPKKLDEDKYIGCVVAETFHNPRLDIYALEHPKIVEESLGYCIDTIRWMSGELKPLDDKIYACGDKLLESLEKIGPVSSRTRDAINEVNEIHRGNSTLSFLDICFPNIVYDEAAESIKQRAINFDWETCPQKTTEGHLFADLIMKMDFDLPADVHREYRSVYSKKMGMALDRLLLGEFIRGSRLVTQYGSFHAPLIPRFARVTVKDLLGIDMEPTEKGLFEVWEKKSDDIIAMARDYS